ncbi:hypothetical protein PQI23_13645 [Leucobacter sp. USCH14]|uniref:hypothetical protein n=1 Tax=Leucobacter sp. USCH14 TaxID=3024838 RepID=UPI00309D9123
MNAWIPWDADEDEVEELMRIRERIPEELQRPLYSWTLKTASDLGPHISDTRLMEFRSALRLPFDPTKGSLQRTFMTDQFVSDVFRLGEKWALRLVDYLCSEYSDREGYAAHEDIIELQWHLDHTGSSLTLSGDGSVFRLANRLTEGIEEAGASAVASSPSVSGRHLSAAWNLIRAIEPDTSKAMNEAMKAAEIAVGALVTPNDGRPRMSKCVQRLRDKQDWELVLERRGDGHPDHRAVVIGMLETLALAQPDRHGGEPPTFEQAQAHVMLASMIVGWFSTGAIRFTNKA